jgi:hypothetical protein
MGLQYTASELLLLTGLGRRLKFGHTLARWMTQQRRRSSGVGVRLDRYPRSLMKRADQGEAA